MMHRISGLLAWILLLTGSGVLSMPQNEDYNPDYLDYGGEADNVDEGDVVVNEGVRKFQAQSRTITVIEGESVEFNCKTVEPTQDILLFMKKSKESDGVLYVGSMHVSSRFVTNEPGIFTLPNARRFNAATYICIYQNKPPVVLEYTLEVQYPPSIKLTTAPEQRVPKGDSLSMACEAKGNPEPEIMWSKVDGKMPSGQAMEKGLSLTLQNVDRHVEGRYVCAASNGIGNPASRETRVFVEYAPEIVTEKAIIRTGEGDKVELVCIVHARPVARVAWFKDGKDLQQEEGGEVLETEGGHRHIITIPTVTDESFGSYNCRAENEKGEDEAIINLTDLPKMPHFTSELTSAKEDEYTLTWVTESYYPIREYNLKYRMAKVNESSDEPGPWIEVPMQLNDEDVASDGLNHKMNHTLTDLKPATDYQAKVTVKNEYKWGAEATINFSTRKAAPSTTQSPTQAPVENEKNKVEETVSPRTTAGCGFISFSVALMVASIIFSLSS